MMRQEEDVREGSANVLVVPVLYESTVLFARTYTRSLLDIV
jgi:hypothetical protein